MRANEIKVTKFLSQNNTRFVIPVYQRNYNWSKLECKQLLNDIIEVGKNKGTNDHFIGSIFYIQNENNASPTSESVTEYTVIDGQQRLTTLTLIYLVLYRIAEELNNERLKAEISETYLINKFAYEEDEKLKLKPTENNDKALKYLLKGVNEEFPDKSKLINNFNDLKKLITDENYQIVRKGLAKLVFVEISLIKGENDPQRIFESLNSTGLELSQADLIRNYILIGLGREDQNKIYQNYWEVIEKFAKDKDSNSQVSHYIRDYLTLINKKIPKIGEVYLAFKVKYPTVSTESISELEGYLEDIKRLVKHYSKLINPQNEKDEDIKLHLNYINRLEINVAFPFLMKVYDDYDSKIIDKSTFLKVLELVQSFAWRRFIVGAPTNTLNKIFMSLYDKVDREKYLRSIQESLLKKSGIQRFPKDEEVKEVLKSRNVYEIKPKSRVYFLDRLENFENKEFVPIENNPKITIEHIFPQRPGRQWKIDVDKEYDFIMGNYLHVIGNLTLSGSNGELGNRPFREKRELYKKSRLWMNKDLSNLDGDIWGKAQIEERIALMSKRFLKIWGYPHGVETDRDNREINIFDADNPTGKRLEYAIFREQILEVTQVKKLYEEVFKLLFKEQPELFFKSDLSKQIKLTNNPSEIKEMLRPIQIGDTYFIKANMNNISIFERIKQALEICDLEEELFIKYAENE